MPWARLSRSSSALANSGFAGPRFVDPVPGHLRQEAAGWAEVLLSAPLSGGLGPQDAGPAKLSGDGSTHDRAVGGDLQDRQPALHRAVAAPKRKMPSRPANPAGSVSAPRPNAPPPAPGPATAVPSGVRLSATASATAS